MPPPAEAGFGVDAGKRNKESRGGKRTVQKKTLKKKVFILSIGKKGKLMLKAEGSLGHPGDIKCLYFNQKG